MKPSKRIAVIGAGPVGLTAIKSCKEVGFEPVCFEQNDDLGGLWKYRESATERNASVMKTTVMNSSKEMSAYSDFPPPEDFANFMHHTQMLAYITLYAEHLGLTKYIRYCLEVIKVTPTKDHEITGRWTVSARNLKTQEEVNEEFDAVMVCTGHHVHPNIPDFLGQENFSGSIIHSHNVKCCESFRDKIVVVVGLGNSGADIAVESTVFAKKVYMSTRRGSWIFSRLGINGRPYDIDYSTRKNALFRAFMPYNYTCSGIEEVLNQKFDHSVYNVKPMHRVLSAHPTINDYFPSCVLSGRITIKKDINRLEENGVVFEGEDQATEADIIVLATGYNLKFPFLEETINMKENQVNLYKFTIPPTLHHHTLAFIGLIQPVGPFFAIGEMQSRWFVQLLLGNIKLPSKTDMLKDIRTKKDAMLKRYTSSKRHTIQADWIQYMDELSSEFGAKPDMLKMIVTDPKLFFACFNGPCLPYQYRLQGPYAWPGAREAILKYEDRVYAPFKSSKLTKKSQRRNFIVISTLILFLSSGFYSVFILNKF